MKRLWISIVILVFIALAAGTSVYAIKRSNEHLCELTSRAEQAYRQGGDVASALAELEDCWDDYYLLMSYIVAEPTMTDITRTVKKLPALYEQGSDDFLAELQSISSWAQMLYDTQFPDLSSVF